MSKRKLDRAIKRIDTGKSDRFKEFPGTLGIRRRNENQVEVNGREGFVWVRLRGNQNELIQAFNDKVAPVYNLPVLVIRDKLDPTRYRIQSRDIAQYQNWGSSSAYLPRHGSTHSFNPVSPGGDITWVFGKQFLPLLLYPSGSSGAGNVLIQESVFFRNNLYQHILLTGTPDVVGLKPTNNQAKMVLVYLDDTNTPQLSGGSLFNASLTGTSDVLPFIPALSSASHIPVGAVRLVSGTSRITWSNLYDLRPFFRDHSGGTGGAGGLSALGIFDSGIFKVSGTAISFDNELDVAVTGTFAYINYGGCVTHTCATTGFRIAGGTSTVRTLVWESAFQLDTGGDARGTQAVDLQINRNNSSEVASGPRAVILAGLDNTAGENQSVVMGQQGKSNTPNQFAQGAYPTGVVFTDAVQGGMYVLAGQEFHDTTNWFSLRYEGTGEGIAVPNSSSITFHALIVGQNTEASDVWSYEITGNISNNGGTTTLNASTVNTIYEADASFAAQAVADDTNDRLLIQVRDGTGNYSDDVTWACHIRTAEVINFE
jgi:hypothetical protein